MENIYSKLLDLPEQVTEPTYYQLLSLREGHHSEGKIERCYKHQLQKLQNLGNNPKYKDAILYIKAELRQARATLGSVPKKKEYDRRLLEQRLEKLEDEAKLFQVKGYLHEKEKNYLMRRGRELKVSQSQLQKLLSTHKVGRGSRWKGFFPHNSPTAKEKAAKFLWQTMALGCSVLALYLYFHDMYLASQLQQMREKLQRRPNRAQVVAEKRSPKTSPDYPIEEAPPSEPEREERPDYRELIDEIKERHEREGQQEDDDKEVPTEKAVEDEQVPDQGDSEAEADLDPPSQEKHRDMLPGMVYVPPGYFHMGSEDHEDTQPVRKVYLDGFYISRHEVTNRQYRKFVRDTGHPVPYAFNNESEPFRWDPTTKDYPGGMENHPVVLVSWEDAMDYCRWLSKKTGYRITLPTEAQWEKAARGVDSYKYPWGNEDPDAAGVYRANYMDKTDRSDGFPLLAPVGSFAAGQSSFGCLDMSGNVAEWCLDRYEKYAYTMLPLKNPVMGRDSVLSTHHHVLRGGSWEARMPFFLSCSYRHFGRNDEKNIRWGFRYVALKSKEQ